MTLEHQATDPQALRAVKLVHTLAWALFAGCIVALPVAAYLRNFRLAMLLIAIVLVEVAVLFANRFKCPLTAVAARYTSDRRANFDIYLPMWIARYNKEIFGTLFVAGVLFTIALWRFASTEGPARTPLILGGVCVGIAIVYFLVWPKPKSQELAASRTLATHIFLRWFHALVWAIFALACLSWAFAARQLAAQLSLLALLMYVAFLFVLVADRKKERRHL